MTKYCKSSSKKDYIIGIESQKIIDTYVDLIHTTEQLVGKNDKIYYVESNEIKDTIKIKPLVNNIGENVKWNKAF